MAIPRELYPSFPPEDIKDHLEADSYNSEEQTYYRSLTPDELQQRREKMPTLDIRIADLEAERKAKNDELKGKIKPLAADKTKMLTEVRSGQLQERGMTYTMLFHDEGKAGVYNSFGQLITERRMTAEERQHKIRFDD